MSLVNLAFVSNSENVIHNYLEYLFRYMYILHCSIHIKEDYKCTFYNVQMKQFKQLHPYQFSYDLAELYE